MARPHHAVLGRLAQRTCVSAEFSHGPCPQCFEAKYPEFVGDEDKAGK